MVVVLCLEGKEVVFGRREYNLVCVINQVFKGYKVNVIQLLRYVVVCGIVVVVIYKEIVVFGYVVDVGVVCV